MYQPTFSENIHAMVPKPKAREESASSSSSLYPGADASILEIKKTAPVTATDIAALEDVSRDLRSDPAARTAFLATFTAEEEKAIMKKVDKRFL